MKVHTRTAQTLHAAGIDTVFGLIGDGNLHHVVSFIDEYDGRFVPALDEAGAVSMADGFARTTGRIGVASVTHGPGITNTLTALTEAVRARSHVVVLTGDTGSAPDHLQQLDIQAAATLAGADYVRVLRPENAGDQLWQALHRVVTTSTPVVFDVPVDLALSDGAAPGRARTLEYPATAASTDALDAALGIIASARRPVLLAGQGAVAAGARDELLRLADIIGAPVATTLLARGYFDGRTYDLGIVGTIGLPESTEIIAESDLLIAFGAGLNRFTTADGAFLVNRAVVQIDRDPRAIGTLAPPTAALVGDARTTAQSLSDSLSAAEHVSHRWRERRPTRVDRRPHPRHEPQTGTDVVDLREALLILDETLPANRLVVTDTGRFIYQTWRHLRVSDPRSFVHTLNFASIGLGLASAVGVSIAHPGRLTVAVAGDGGGMMAMGELTTAVREKLPLLVVIVNDSAYGMEFRNMTAAGIDPSHSRSQWPSFADVARGYGAIGHTTRCSSELEKVLSNLDPLPSVPVVVELRTDPEIDPDE